MHHLPATGYLRLPLIIGELGAKPPVSAVIPVSRSPWWAGERSGRYLQQTGTFGLRITAWRMEDVRALIQRAAGVQ